MLKWGKRDGGRETEIHTPPLSFLTSAASQLFHNSVQAASSSSPDRFEDDCTVRTFINKIHHRHAVEEHNTNTCTQRQTHSCTRLWHDDEWHTSTFPSTARSLQRGCKEEPSSPRCSVMIMKITCNNLYDVPLLKAGWSATCWKFEVTWGEIG